MVATYGLEPLLEALGVQLDLGRYEGFVGNRQMLGIYLTVSWTTAGFREELSLASYCSRFFRFSSRALRFCSSICFCLASFAVSAIATKSAPPSLSFIISNME